VESVPEMKIDFKGLLMELFRVACAMCVEWLREYLWEKDEEIQRSLPRGRYEFHEVRTRTLETIIGPVEIRRRYYRDRETGGHVFLLDRALGLKGAVRVGPALQGVVAQCSTDCSFRLGKKGRSWSEAGLEAMLAILCSWLEGTLAQYAGRYGGDTELEPVWAVDQVRETRVGQGDPGGVRRGHFPALDHGTQGFAPLFRKLKEVPVNF